MDKIDSVQHVKWEEMEKEELNPKIHRRMITGEKSMITQIFLKKGAVVPLHHHINEQLTFVVSGALKFWIGSEDAEPVIVRGGEVLVLPENVPHKAEALEDTVDVDVFCPPRQDWLDKTDDYLRG